MMVWWPKHVASKVKDKILLCLSENKYIFFSNYQLNVHFLYSITIRVYRVSQEERTKLREGVPYVKLYRYNPKHLCPKLNGFWDKGQIKLWTSFGSTNDSCQLGTLIYNCSPEMHIPAYVRQAGWRHRLAFQCDV